MTYNLTYFKTLIIKKEQQLSKIYNNKEKLLQKKNKKLINQQKNLKGMKANM